MENRIFTSIMFLLSLTCAAAGERTAYQMPRTQVIPIKDSASGGQYELYIKLPENYIAEKDSTHPVIYFTDAVWHIEMLSAATEFLMENAILVGISWQQDINQDLIKDADAHVSRYRDYSARQSSNPEHQAKYHFGQASQHLNFIRNEVIKYVENKYRTAPGHRTYFGYSLGGEFGAYTMLVQPDTFNNYILGSPSLRSDDIAYFTELAAENALKHESLNTHVYISYGTLEQEVSTHIDQFITLLKNKENEGLLLKHAVIEGSHQTAFPLTGVRSVNWLANLSKKGAQQ